ncbi:MAG: hypothetical protein JW798_00805 [Prolixibacteraceae bacterium]|nr:hypothetical protein [Prolixibacteraceae bacterium]
MKKNTGKKPAGITRSRKIIFNIQIALLPIIILLFLEIFLRAVGYGDNLKLFIKHPDKEYAQYKVVNPEIGKKYFQRFEYSRPAKDIFLRKKTDDVFRVFVMGSSTVVGFPYDNNIMFSRILHERLREAYPNKKIEMVNTAITAINSFTLLDFMPQILKEKPDAILFYAGHNEYYGAFGAGSNEAVAHNPAIIAMHLKLMGSRVYQLIRNIISGTGNLFARVKTAGDRRGTLMSRIVKDADITYDSPVYLKGMEYYKRNLEIMLAMASNKGVPFFIGEVVSNISDIKPFKSKGTSTLKPAIDYYQLGKKLEESGAYNEAKENYSLSRDYDCIRFRASGEVNKIINELSEKYDATLVPVLGVFEAKSPNGLVGNELMTEHVHPNIDGYFLMADAFYNALVSSGLIGEEADKDAPVFNEKYKENYGYTILDELVGKHRVTNLSYHWPFVDESQGFTDYRQVYKPVSVADSLAFNVMARNDVSLTDTHEKVARLFERNRDYWNAFREYNALTKINPYWPLHFRSAADCLLSMADLPVALKYYLRSLEFENSFYAHFRAGEIFMIKNDIDNAIVHFEEALVLADEEKPNVLAKLIVAYAYKGDKENFIRVKNELNKIKPGQKINIPVRKYTYLNYIPDRVKNFIIEADNAVKQQDMELAEVKLIQSFDVMDSHLARRKLGELYFQQGKYGQSIIHLEKAENEFGFDPRFLHMLCLNYLELGDKPGAKKCIEKLKLTDPGFPALNELQNLLKQNIN